MPNYSGSFQFYDSFREQMAKSMNLGTDTFKMLLVTSAYIPDVSSHSVLADINNEAGGNGYARQTLQNVTYERSGNKSIFDFDDVTFEATGGSWTARRFVLYNDTVSSPEKPLVGFGLIRSDNQNVTVTDGNTLKFQTPVGGLFEQT